MNFNYGNVAKAVGAASILAIGYDTISNGVRNGKDRANIDIGNYCTKVVVNNTYSNRESPMLDRMKGWYQNSVLQSGALSDFFTVKNIFFSMISSIGKNLIPIGLSLGAICGEKIAGQRFGPIVSKVSAVLLGLFGAKTIGTEVFGIGKRNYID